LFPQVLSIHLSGVDTERRKGNLAEESDEFDPKAKAKQAKQKNKSQAFPVSEETRADLYTLKEHHHEHLFSSSFDASFHGSGGALHPSSSQADGAFAFDDYFLDGIDGFDVTRELGAELARELGEGWGSPAKTLNE
jgi:meiotic recombination protein REC8